MSNGFLIGHDEAVSEWAWQTFHIFRAPVNRAYGILDSNQKLIGAMLLQCFNGYNIELSYYGPWALTPGIVKALARATLAEFPISRATVVTSKRNKRLIRALQKFGWRIEGIQRRQFGHADTQRNTGVRLVMFREQIERIAGLRHTDVISTPARL